MKTRTLLILAGVLGLGAVAFGYNSQRHVDTTVAAILQADGVGTDPAADVQALQKYVAGHLGTHASFTLTAAYQRAVAQAKEAAAAQSQNSQVYAAAQGACGGKTDSVTQAKCVQDYVSKRLVAVPAAAPAQTPQVASYKYNLRAPLWTPDLTGWLALGAFAAGLAGLAKFIGQRRAKL